MTVATSTALQPFGKNAKSSNPSSDTSDNATTDALFERLFETRHLSTELSAPLSDEDQTVQACADASPTKWHLAHTTWFFESFLLAPQLPGYERFSDDFEYCFNSYYEAKGARHPRAARGLLSRPSAREVRDYRAHVDRALSDLAVSTLAERDDIRALVELGINHEQQHQELLLTDILALFARQPLAPAYVPPSARDQLHHPTSPPCEMVPFEGGIYQIGHDGAGFAYDNEGPRHETLLRPFRIASRLVTNAEWRAFMDDGGYDRHEFWLADGWAWVRENNIRAPGYWEHDETGWRQMTLHGLTAPAAASPVCHISYYEADAFAKWAGKRLPTEAEWEVASSTSRAAPPNDLGTGSLRPLPAPAPRPGLLDQMFGDVWEWTQSAYQPYPGYRAPAGAVGEYNGKFMCSQQVLRGGSCATPAGHTRATYRNFFYPFQRWQFMGLRLAEDG